MSVTVKSRIAAIRLMEKIEQNTEYAEKIGVNINFKKNKKASKSVRSEKHEG